MEINNLLQLNPKPVRPVKEEKMTALNKNNGFKEKVEMSSDGIKPKEIATSKEVNNSNEGKEIKEIKEKEKMAVTIKNNDLKKKEEMSSDGIKPKEIATSKEVNNSNEGKEIKETKEKEKMAVTFKNNDLKKKAELENSKEGKEIKKTDEVENSEEIKEGKIVATLSQEAIKGQLKIGIPLGKTTIPIPEKKEFGNLKISSDDLHALLKEVSNKNSDTNDLMKILKTINVYQKNGDKIDQIGQVKGNLLMEKIEEMINKIENIELKDLLKELNENLKNPGPDLLVNIEKIGILVEKIDLFLRTLDKAGLQTATLKSLPGFIDQLKEDIKAAESLKVQVGKIDLMETKEVGGLADKPAESVDFLVGNENKAMDKLTEKGVKYQEMTLDQFKKDVGDKLNQIEKLITMKDKMLIQLNPKNLGNLELFIQKTNGAIEITVEFEKKMAKVHLEAILDEVKKDFKERDIDIQFNFKEKEKEQKDEENRERKNENQDIEGNLKDEKDKLVFEEMIEELLGGKLSGSK